MHLPIYLLEGSHGSGPEPCNAGNEPSLCVLGLLDYLYAMLGGILMCRGASAEYICYARWKEKVTLESDV